MWLTDFLISVGLALGVRVGTQKLGSLGLLLLLPPLERWSLELPLAGLEEEEVAALELVVASSAMLLILGATDLVLDWRREGTLNGG